MEHQTMSFMVGFDYELMAHELLHQWFGDAVTCGSWQDIWLNEGFATYYTALNYEKFSPTYYWPDWKENVVNYVTSEPFGSVFVYDTTDVYRVFDGRLSYNKGAYVLHMLRWVVGDNNFFQGNRNYFTDYYFDYAKSPDYIAHMETQSGMDLTEFFNDWLYNEGYPTYNILVNHIPGDSVSVLINQTQSHASVSFFEMPVPVTFYQGGKDTTFVFNNTFSGQEFRVAYAGTPDSVVFDPELHLLSRNNSLVLSLSEDKAPVLSLYPNPAEDLIHIDGLQNSTCAYKVFDARGASVASGFTDGSNPISVTSLPAGYYRIQLQGNDWKYTGSFIRK